MQLVQGNVLADRKQLAEIRCNGFSWPKPLEPNKRLDPAYTCSYSHSSSTHPAYLYELRAATRPARLSILAAALSFISSQVNDTWPSAWPAETQPPTSDGSGSGSGSSCQSV